MGLPISPDVHLIDDSMHFSQEMDMDVLGHGRTGTWTYWDMDVLAGRYGMYVHVPDVMKKKESHNV